MSDSVKMKCKIVTFKNVYQMTRDTAQLIKASEYLPTTVVGLARGGWIPARLMCDFIGITDLISLKVEHWVETGMTKDEATIKYPLTINLSGKRLLVVDDITDTGKSLITAVDYLSQFQPDDVRVATMQYIPGSTYRPDYFCEEVKEWTWFIYPWNWVEDTSTLIVRLMNTRMNEEWSSEEISNGLTDNFEITWDEEMLNYILSVMVERAQLELIEEVSYKAFKLKEARILRFI